jgi:hypothetical protein
MTPEPDTKIPTSIDDPDLTSAGLPVLQPYYVAVAADPMAPDGTRSLLGSHDNGNYCADGYGGRWTFPQVFGDGASLVFAPSDPNRFYARGIGPTQFVSASNAADMAGGSCDAIQWRPGTVIPIASRYTDELPFLWVRAMTAVHPADPNLVYLARPYDFAAGQYDNDSGNLQITLEMMLPRNARPVSVFVHPIPPYDIYVGTLGAGAYVSRDGGRHFTDWALNTCPPDCPVPTAVMGIAWTPIDSVPGSEVGTFFLATTNGLYQKTTDSEWTRVEGDGSYTASTVTIDWQNCPNRVNTGWGYVGVLGRHRGGVSVRHVLDETSVSITAGLDIHGSPITDLQVDPVHPKRYLHAATFGRGAWIYDRGADDCNAF